MPTPRSAHAVALAVAVLAACGERAPSAPAAPSAPVAGTATTVAPEPAVPPPAADAAPAAVPPVGAAAAPSTTAQVAPAPGTAPAQVPPGAGTAPAQIAPAPGTAPAATPTSPPTPAEPPSVATIFREVVALEPGGAALQLALDRETVVDSGARFRVVLSISSPDARMLLLDRSDALVAAEGAHEVGQSTRLTLTPSAPLTPGRRYLLRIDGASTRELHDPAGKAYVPATLQILVAGTPPPPEPKEKPAPRRKRRGR